MELKNSWRLLNNRNNETHKRNNGQHGNSHDMSGKSFNTLTCIYYNIDKRDMSMNLFSCVLILKQEGDNWLTFYWKRQYRCHDTIGKRIKHAWGAMGHNSNVLFVSNKVVRVWLLMLIVCIYTICYTNSFFITCHKCEHQLPNM